MSTNIHTLGKFSLILSILPGIFNNNLLSEAEDIIASVVCFWKEILIKNTSKIDRIKDNLSKEILYMNVMYENTYEYTA